MDASIQNMNYKTVHLRLCADLKQEPEEALRKMFAVAFQEGSSQQRSFGGEQK